MKSFREYIKESYTYNLSRDVQVLMYDFYVLSYIRTLNLKETELEYTGSFISKSPEELHSLLENASNKLLPAVKKEILDAVFYSICSEQRQIIDLPLSFFKYFKIDQFVSADQFKLLQAILDQIPQVPSDSESIADSDISTISRDQMVAIVGRAIEQTNNTRSTFIRTAQVIFNKLPIWDINPHNNTGKTWASICAGWLDLSAATSAADMCIAIDHIYDIQHMTGSVFDKVPRYIKNGSIDWMKTALDFKAGITNITQLLPHCSSDMSKLARIVLKRARSK